jgi:acyl-CoA thioesterase-1
LQPHLLWQGCSASDKSNRRQFGGLKILLHRPLHQPVQTILFFGDSLTAGYGLDDPADAFPGVIAKKIDSLKLPYKVINAGVSGETSAGGNGRIDWTLKQKVDIFILELGANDGLRGIRLQKHQESAIHIDK